jgi:transcription elongation factor SPT6
LDGSRALFAAELSVQPSFRARISECFDLYGVVSTKATPQGKLYIDLHHPFANVRHLKNKPVSSFRGSAIFLQILKAVEEGLLQVAISLPKERVDTLVAQMGGAAFNLEALSTWESDKEGSNYLWASYRRQILVDAVQLIIPKLITRCKAKLHRDATQVVLNETEQALEKMIRVGGIHIPASRTFKRASSGKKSKGHHPMLEEEEESVPPLVSICVGDPTQSREVLAMIAVVDEFGELKDTLSILASLRVEDSIAIRELLRKHMPFAVAIGIDTPLAKTFYAKIQELLNSFVAEESIPSIRCIPVPLDIATVFQATKHADKEFNASAFVTPTPEAGLMLRRCASAARRLLDPLSEIAGLFTQQDYILGLDLHPLRKLVSQSALKRRLENAFVRVVSEVGVDVNRILEHSWMQSVLQFVCGLGPRKAASLLEGLLRNHDSPLESRNQLKDSAENSQLRPGEYLGPAVWDNAVAFLKVVSTDKHYIRDWNPLDGTRIHPVAYAIAKKIGDDLVSTGHIHAHDSYVSAIARDPTVLKHVDLSAMIEKLRSKQVYKELTVRALVEELKAPFADPRVYSEFQMSTIFDLVVGKGSLDVGMVVTVRVTWQDRQTFTWEVALPNHITGTIAQTDAPEKLTRGQNIQAQVIGVDKELFKCQLTCNIGSSTWNANEVPNKDPWLENEEIDLGEAAAALAKTQPSIVTRTFVHRHFQNKNRAESEEFLATKPIGSYLIHPTSKKNYLSITSRFHFDTFAHISVEELPDGTLKIDKEVYDNLDDLVARFMEPMLINVKELESAPCFKVLNKADMIPFIQAEKRSTPNRSPYHIAPSQEKPGFFVLYYIPGSTTVQKEYVHVVPDGFKYRSIIHKSVNRLIAYFKKHFNDPAFLQQQQQQRNGAPQHSAPHNYATSYQAPQWPAPQHYPPPMHTGRSYGMPQQY